MVWSLSARLALFALVIWTACSPAPTRSTTGSGDAPRTEARPTPTLITVQRSEPQSLASRPLTGTGGGIAFAVRVFNADLDMIDGQDEARPYLAEALPQLNTESWKVLPDGGMETSYHLKPNLVWHDNTPLTAEDFVFALEVFKSPELGASGAEPIRLMDEITAPDPRTVVIKWKTLYPSAGVLSRIGTIGNGGFQPLPRHIIEQSFRNDASDVFANQTYWSNKYIGLGPYKLERWEPGAYVEGSAFEGHVLGRPKIDRIIVRFMADENTVLANLLSESIHLATDRAIRFEHTQVMRKEWESSKRGVILLTLSNVRYILMQNRPEFVTPPAMTSLAVRKALNSSIDKQALNDGVFEGVATTTDTFLAPDVPFFADIDRAITKYPYDPRRTEQLMNEAGLTRDRDGFFVSAGGERFSPLFWEESGPQNEKELLVFIDTWRKAGIDMQSYVLNVVQFGDGQFRASFPAMYTTQGGGSTEDRLNFLATSTTPSAQNRWQGNNRGAWVNAEYDRLWDAFNRTLDRSERNQHVVQMLKLISEELPAIPYYFNFAPTAHLASLKGVEMGARVPDPRIYWNIHEWSWAQS